MRPTGRLHIGHYFGALKNWVRLQNSADEKGPAYDCFYFIADWHALTSDYADTSAIAENTLQIMIDYLAAGLDPKKSVLFQQSVIPEHAELHLLLSMVTPLGWLERVPTYKEALENVKDKDLYNYGFLGYPILQCADIVIYSKEGAPLVVPVGEDQVSHVEISREIVRRFNLFYGFELHEALRSKSAAGLCGNFCLALGIPGNTLSMLDFPLGSEKWAEFVSRVRARILEIGIDNAIEHLKAGAVADMVKFLPVLQEPEVKLTLPPRIPGTDGRKMPKSYGNAITLRESDAAIGSKKARKVAKGTMERVRESVFGWEKKRDEIRNSEVTR